MNCDSNIDTAAVDQITLADLLILAQNASGGNYDASNIVLVFSGPLLAADALPNMIFERAIVDGDVVNTLVIEPKIDNFAVLEIAADKDREIATLHATQAEQDNMIEVLDKALDDADAENEKLVAEIAELKKQLPKKRGPKPGTKYAVRAPKKPATKKRAKR